MADFDFDRVIDRRSTDSNKWRKFPADVLPLWVADMDFPSPPAVVRALHARVEGPQGGKTVSEEWVWTRAR